MCDKGIIVPTEQLYVFFSGLYNAINRHSQLEPTQVRHIQVVLKLANRVVSLWVQSLFEATPKHLWQRGT